MLFDFRPVGSLHVYALMTEEDHKNNAPYTGKIYWSDSIAVSPQGPFRGVWEAVESFKIIAEARFYLHKTEGDIPISNKIKDPAPNNVLNLDAFRASRPRRHW